MPCPAGSFHRWPRCSHHVGNRPRSTTLSSSCRGIVRPALVWRGLAPFCDLGRAERRGSAKSWRRSDGMKRRIVGVFEPPLLHQRSDTPCLTITSSNSPSQTALPIL
jgi:hypothetical protein